MRLEYLRLQEIDHVTVRAAESAHQRVAVGSVLQRERGEIEPGRPSLRLHHQGFDIFGREVEPEAAVQEGVRLLAGESQVAGPQLEQLTVGAQRRDRQGRLCPAREHELEPGRRMLDEPGDALPRRTAREPVEVIQDERDLTLAVQLVDQARQDHVNDRRHDRMRRRRPGDGGACAAERLDRMRPEDYRVVVAFVQRQPRDGFPRGLGLAPRRQQGSLPEARRAGNQSEPAVRPASKTFQEALARNRQLAHRRRMQLRADQDRLPRTLSHPVACGGVLPFRGALAGLRHYLTARQTRCLPAVGCLLRRAHSA